MDSEVLEIVKTTTKLVMVIKKSGVKKEFRIVLSSRRDPFAYLWLINA